MAARTPAHGRSRPAKKAVRAGREAEQASGLQGALRRIVSQLEEAGAPFALIGGLAVSIRSTPRSTADVDLAISAPTDRDAEALIFHLQQAGYRLDSVLETKSGHRIATVRLTWPGEAFLVDLLFDVTGIEEAVVAAAERWPVLPGLTLPVAKTGHLVAMKVYAARMQDKADVVSLLRAGGPTALRLAKSALHQVQKAGRAKGRRLTNELDALIAEAEGKRRPSSVRRRKADSK